MAEIKDLDKIIAGCKDGNSRSFDRLVDIYSNRFYGYFYRLTGSRSLSDDLLGELFVKLVRKIKSFREGNFDSWLFKIASNVFRDHLREKQRRQKMMEYQREQFEASPDSIRESGGERADKLQSQLDKLDSETRELIVLRFYSQLSFKEMARMRAEPIGTVLSKVHRGLKRLRELMEE